MKHGRGRPRLHIPAYGRTGVLAHARYGMMKVLVTPAATCPFPSAGLRAHRKPHEDRA